MTGPPTLRAHSLVVLIWLNADRPTRRLHQRLWVGILPGQGELLPIGSPWVAPPPVAVPRPGHRHEVELTAPSPVISLLVGVAFGPNGANLIRPLDYARGSQESLNDITLYFSRLVLGVQLVLAGIQLPSRYLRKEWKPLSLLVGPIMTLMWLCTSLLIWAMVPRLPYLHALAIAASVTPTDPVLSNVIVKGRFADANVPKELQKIIIAESGANDGLGYPFLFCALYLIKYIGDGGRAVPGGAHTAMRLWFAETWGYTILLSVAYGAIVGWVAKEALHYAEGRRWVDRESFLVFALSLALFITGTCGMIGSDDVLACFIAGNIFTWDDWFRLETLDEASSPPPPGRPLCQAPLTRLQLV